MGALLKRISIVFLIMIMNRDKLTSVWKAKQSGIDRLRQAGSGQALPAKWWGQAFNSRVTWLSGSVPGSGSGSATIFLWWGANAALRAAIWCGASTREEGLGSFESKSQASTGEGLDCSESEGEHERRRPGLFWIRASAWAGNLRYLISFCHLSNESRIMFDA